MRVWTVVFDVLGTLGFDLDRYSFDLVANRIWRAFVELALFNSEVSNGGSEEVLQITKYGCVVCMSRDLLYTLNEVHIF